MRTLVVNALRMGGERTAIGRHIEHLTQQWSRMEIPFDRVVLVSPCDLRIERLGRRTPIEVRAYGRRWPSLLWEQGILPLLASKSACLLSFYACPLSYRGAVVVSNHGIYEAIPRTFSWWKRMRATPINRRSALRANRIIANSCSTKADLVRYFRVAASKIDVIYPGPADVFFEAHIEESIGAEVSRVFGENVPYVIFVGKLAKRRHVPNLIEAFSIVRTKERLPHRLLIVGPNTSKVPLEALAAQHRVSEALAYRPYMNQEELARLYAGADLFVLPSVYEGLSRTMLEAMASGTAVLTVDHRALTEGGGDAVLAVPTPGVADLVGGMTELLTDPVLRREYEKRGLERAGRFSMGECATKTMAVLDEVSPRSDR